MKIACTKLSAMILAAGLGTRLGSLTQQRPKALVPVADTSLLAFNLNRLKRLGINNIIVNVHHLGGQIIEYLQAHKNFGLEIQISDERDQLMDTGGGILQALPLIEPGHHLLVYNVDIISNFPLTELIRFHFNQQAAATLLVRDRTSSRKLYFSPQMQLSAWENLAQKNKIIVKGAALSNASPLAFSGIHILNPEPFQQFTLKPCSIIGLYLELAAREKVMGYRDQADIWMDVGKPDQLKKAELLISKGAFRSEAGRNKNQT